MRRLFLLFISFLFVVSANATHLMGGEITWKCLKSGPNIGQYIFTMKLYRDCNGMTLPSVAQTINVWEGATGPHPSVPTISLAFIGSNDISPNCNSVNSGNVSFDCTTNPIGAVEEYVYESNPISLPGIPPADGWHFTWDSCCRNGAISNLVISTANSMPIESLK